MSRLPLALVLVAALAPASGCGKDDCPPPAFANPPTVAVVGQTLVVRWPATAGDKVPLAYYQKLSLGGNGSPTPVRRATLTADRELTLEVEGLDAFARANKTLDVVLGMPDTRDFVQCGHPGTSDDYAVTLTLSLDAGKVTGARFSPVHRHRGAL